MEIINYDGITIEYYIAKRGTKNLYARLEDNNVIKLSVPYFASKKLIEQFVIDSYFKLKKRKEKRAKQFDRDKIKILGVEYENITDNLDYLLIIKLKEYLKENYLNIVKNMGYEIPPRVILKRVKGYLGQYNKKNHTITLNILIAHLDKECVEYVIVHELAHIRYLNHQQEFWDEVKKYLPNYKTLRLKAKKEFVYYENY